MRRKQNFDFRVFFFEKVSLPFRLFLSLSLFPAFFAFPSPFFFFCWEFTRLPSGGKRFCRKFEDRDIFWKELRVGSGTRFSLEFSGQGYTVFLRLSLVCLTESRLFGHGLKDLIPLHTLVVKVV